MDLLTIMNKIRQGVYDSEQQVRDDVALVFSNCRTYNLPEAPVYEVIYNYYYYYYYYYYY